MSRSTVGGDGPKLYIFEPTFFDERDDLFH